MSSKPIISIIGLGLTGTSLGLSLQRQEGNFEIVGHDKNPDAAKEASRLGAIHKNSWNLYNAVDNAEMVILATPLDQLKELLSLLRNDLREGCLVIACTKVMQPALDLAAHYLPENVHFVATHPVLSGVGGRLSIRSDLFEDAPFCLATSASTDSSALQLASDFAERIGAVPLFIDAVEHDGLVAMVEQLPRLLGAVLLDSVGESYSWREGGKLAGRAFAQSTELGSPPDSLFHDIATNRENLLARIDMFQETLTAWRSMLASDIQSDARVDTTADADEKIVADPSALQDSGASEEQHPLLAALWRAYQTREKWETRAILKDWDMEPLVETPSTGSFMQQMFFGNLFRSRADRITASRANAAAEGVNNNAATNKNAALNKDTAAKKDAG